MNQHICELRMRNLIRAWKTLAVMHTTGRRKQKKVRLGWVLNPRACDYRCSVLFQQIYHASWEVVIMRVENI